jgi:hypothetical protein
MSCVSLVPCESDIHDTQSLWHCTHDIYNMLVPSIHNTHNIHGMDILYMQDIYSTCGIYGWHMPHMTFMAHMIVMPHMAFMAQVIFMSHMMFITCLAFIIWQYDMFGVYTWMSFMTCVIFWHMQHSGQGTCVVFMTHVMLIACITFVTCMTILIHLAVMTCMKSVSWYL